MFRTVARVERRNIKGKWPLGRPRHGWDDSIKMYLEGSGCEGADCIRRLRAGSSGRLLWTW
jgi:hypothetical protein